MLMTNLKSSVWAAIKGRLRLYIEYVVLGSAIICASFALTMYFQNNRLSSVVGRLNTDLGTQAQQITQLRDDNEAQQHAIDEVERLRQLDHSTLQSLNDALVDVYTRNARVRDQLKKLEQSNVEVRHYLHDIPVPASVRCLLDQSPCPPPTNKDGGQDRQPTVRPSSAVPASRDGNTSRRSPPIVYK